VRGFLGIIHSIWLSETWRELWNALGLSVESFSTIGLSHDSSDALIWRTCQEQHLVLITANRNADGPDSLEVVIRNQNLPDRLPVVTLANPQRLLRDRVSAETVAERLLDDLMDINRFRGAGRIYVP
jgi:hypothetical protein